MQSNLFEQHQATPVEVFVEPEEFMGGTPMKKSQKLLLAEPTTNELKQYSEKLKVSPSFVNN